MNLRVGNIFLVLPRSLSIYYTFYYLKGFYRAKTKLIRSKDKHKTRGNIYNVYHKELNTTRNGQMT